MSVSFSDVWNHIKKNGISPIEDCASFICRPPRANYPIQALGPPVFRIQTTDGGKPCAQAFKRNDFQLPNMRGLNLECSWYRPYISSSTKEHINNNNINTSAKSTAVKFPGEKAKPCVVYLHGNSGCRLDGQEILYVMEKGYTVFTYDASGSGLSGGDHVSLGFYERQDIACVVDYLRDSGIVTTIALYGRSMGAVTSIMYAARDPSIKCIILDSPFSTLRLLISDLVQQHAAWAPDFAVDAIVEKVRRRIIKNAGFDIDDLDTLAAARQCSVPAFLIHGKDDGFVRPFHSELINDVYLGSCLFHEIVGDHNDERGSDARDVAMSLLDLYLVQKPQGELILEAAIEKEKMKKKAEAEASQERENSNEPINDNNSNASSATAAAASSSSSSTTPTTQESTTPSTTPVSVMPRHHEIPTYEVEESGSFAKIKQEKIEQFKKDDASLQKALDVGIADAFS